MTDVQYIQSWWESAYPFAVGLLWPVLLACASCRVVLAVVRSGDTIQS